MTLPNAWLISRLSKVPISGSEPKSALEGDVGAADLDQERGFAQRLAQVHHLHVRLRHAGEGRELVDHAADIGDLADDRVGALVEDLAILGDDLAVAAADALGRELDRGQRVLDLVGDAARHVGPGRGALRLHEIGDVVDGDDVGILLGLVLGLLDRDLHVEGALGAGAEERHLLAIDGAPGIAADLEDAADMRQHRREIAAERALRR